MKKIKLYFSDLIKNILGKFGYVLKSEMIQPEPVVEDKKYLLMGEMDGRRLELTDDGYKRILYLIYGEETAKKVYVDGATTQNTTEEDRLLAEKRFMEAIDKLKPTVNKIQNLTWTQLNNNAPTPTFTVGEGLFGAPYINKPKNIFTTKKTNIVERTQESFNREVSWWNKTKARVRNLLNGETTHKNN